MKKKKSDISYDKWFNYNNLSILFLKNYLNIIN